MATESKVNAEARGGVRQLVVDHLKRNGAPDSLIAEVAASSETAAQPPTGLVKNKSTAENKKFWDHVESTAKEVDSWSAEAAQPMRERKYGEIAALRQWEQDTGRPASAPEGNAFMDGYYAGWQAARAGMGEQKLGELWTEFLWQDAQSGPAIQSTEIIAKKFATFCFKREATSLRPETGVKESAGQNMVYAACVIETVLKLESGLASTSRHTLTLAAHKLREALTGAGEKHGG